MEDCKGTSAERRERRGISPTTRGMGLGLVSEDKDRRAPVSQAGQRKDDCPAWRLTISISPRDPRSLGGASSPAALQKPIPSALRASDLRGSLWPVARQQAPLTAAAREPSPGSALTVHPAQQCQPPSRTFSQLMAKPQSLGMSCAASGCVSLPILFCLHLADSTLPRPGLGQPMRRGVWRGGQADCVEDVGPRAVGSHRRCVSKAAT